MVRYEAEETIKRIKSHKGVQAVLIVNQEGVPIYSSTSDEEFALDHAALISQLAAKAKSTIRTLDPTNDMTFLRIRSKKHEIMIAPDKEYALISDIRRNSGRASTRKDPQKQRHAPAASKLNAADKDVTKPKAKAKRSASQAPDKNTQNDRQSHEAHASHKHDAQEGSRATKARRQRTTTQVRKDKRHDAVMTKRKRLMGAPDDTPTTGRDIAELTRILSTSATATTGPAASHTERFQVLKEIRVLLASHENNYEALEQIIDSGIVPVLVSLLNTASPLASATRTGGEVYREILWCLTNITSGQYEHTKLVLPAVPRLLQFLEGSNHTLAESASWVLGNIGADCDEFRRYLITNGAIVPLVKQLANTQEKGLAKNAAWALSNLARGHETSAKPFVDAGLLPILATRLNQDNAGAFSEETVIEVAWLLSFLTSREEEYLKLMLEQGLIEWLQPYMETANGQLMTLILRVYGNVCCCAMDHHTDDWQLPYIQRLLEGDSVFLRKLHTFLQPTVPADHAHLTSESAWVVSNLATLSNQVVDILIQQQFMQLLAHQFHHGAFEVRREVAFALVNIALTSPTHLEQVLDLDVLKTALQLLSAADLAVVDNSLRFVENVLRVSPRGVSMVEQHGGIDALENVQYQSGEPQLARWAEELVNEFYGENYGVHSPTNQPSAGFGGSIPVLNDTMAMQDVPPAGAGRGRGAHMTMPAWKK
ncbi:TPA: hypothetical protein N0F65_010618 [Lagenidium giganteum]|uniref:Roadblock/LAMTOR2 domain-containing protein n=1 Tax=Lagenidium giganteum TaxID=4803 RepID=A0AAV2ZIL7_9STRA|nr:TPA: hypothetical protein N0F65_010618 [Lagenidium giganteum]